MSMQHVQFRVSHLMVATAIVAAITMAAMSCGSLYELHGAIYSVVMPVALAVFVLVGLSFLASRKFRLPAAVAIIVACGMFSYRQAKLLERLRLLETEVTDIIAYTNKFKAHHGEFPESLSLYRFRRADLNNYVQYASDEARGTYEIRFHPCKEGWLCGCEGLGIYHSYFSDYGYWYCDD